MSCCYKNILQDNIPQEALDIVSSLLEDSNLKIGFIKRLNNRLGFFRVKTPENTPFIYISLSTNKYMFLAILIHELAHYFAWKNNNRKKVQAHGKEWKKEHKSILEKFLDKNIFPSSIEMLLKEYIASEFASKSVRLNMMMAFAKYDNAELQKKTGIFIADLKVGECFRYKEDKYMITKVNRTRSLAKRLLKDQRTFSFYKALAVESP